MAGLKDLLGTPAVYLFLVFVYAILVAIILPIPIEFALIWPLMDGHVPFFAAVVLVMALGKGLGAVAILYLGIKVEKSVYFWADKFKRFGKMVHYLSLFVEKASYVGLYVILSIPLMTDTVPIYLYSIFHPKGNAPARLFFGLSNFLAGINRGVIIAVIFLAFGTPLV